VIYIKFQPPVPEKTVEKNTLKSIYPARRPFLTQIMDRMGG